MHLRLLVVLILAVTLSGGAGFVLGQSSDTAGANGDGAVTLRSVDQRLSRVARDARLARQYSYRACLNAYEFGERLCRAPR